MNREPTTQPREGDNALASEGGESPSRDAEYAPVSGISRENVEQLRMLEAKAAAKTASDYAHIVWAYGVLWSLFAVYGWMLWRRSVRLRSDLTELERRMRDAR